MSCLQYQLDTKRAIECAGKVNPMNEVGLTSALALAQKVIELGRSAGAPPLAVVILDARGRVKVSMAEDGVAAAMAPTAIGKANAALMMETDGRTLSISAASNHFALPGLVNLLGPFVPLPGGVPIVSGRGIIGALGVTGDTADNDERFALDALAACGFTDAAAV